MKRLLAIATVLLFHFTGTAQSVDRQYKQFVESQLQMSPGANEHLLAGSIAEIRDSIQLVRMRKYALREIAADRYIWPWNSYQTEGVDGVPKLTPTWSYVLSTFYGIRPSGLYVGCFGVDGMEVHDSLMKAAIEQKYGSDFFDRTHNTADSLDSIGVGLTLPYLVHPDSTAAYLQRHFGYIDTVSFKEDSEAWQGDRLLIVSFADGKFTSLLPINYQQLKRFDDKNACKRRAKEFAKLACNLPWTGPRFAGKDIKATVAFHLKENILFFYDY